MKNLLYILTLTLTLNSCKSYINTNKTNYTQEEMIEPKSSLAKTIETWSPEQIYEFKQKYIFSSITIISKTDTLKNGEWKDYYKSGKLKTHGILRRNEAIGNWKYYYQNGQLEQEGFWKNDKQNGIWKYYYQNAQLKAEGLWDNDKQNGIWQYYSENNKKKDVYFYNNHITKMTCWDDDGNKIKCKW